MTVAIGILDFVRRQTPESRYAHFDGSWDELVTLVRQQWPHARPSPHNPQVRLVPVPAPWLPRFYASTITVTPDMTLQAEFSPRVPGEDAYIQVCAPDASKTPAQRAEIILYSHDVLAADGDAPPTREADWYIVSVNAYISDQDEPMNPMTMARNLLGLKGGTRPETPYSPEEFARAIVYWSKHVRASGS